MILTKTNILQYISAGTLKISPFEQSNIGPNSYDIRLGNTIMYYPEDVLDTNNPPASLAAQIPPEGLTLSPKKAYWAPSFETVGSTELVTLIKGKSSLARMGLFVHLGADFIPPSDQVPVILQLHPVQPLIVYCGMRIAQLTFWKTN